MALVADEQEADLCRIERAGESAGASPPFQGAGPEVRVGLVLDDPINRIVAVLGVLKAGGAYVPLEPSLPRPRLEGMLDAAGVSIVIVDRGAVWASPAKLRRR